MYDRENAATMLITLQGSELLRLRDARGLAIRVDSGVIWLTEEGRRADRFLRAGSTYVIESDGLVLMEALA